MRPQAERISQQPPGEERFGREAATASQMEEPSAASHTRQEDNTLSSYGSSPSGWGGSAFWDQGSSGTQSEDDSTSWSGRASNLSRGSTLVGEKEVLMAYSLPSHTCIAATKFKVLKKVLRRTRRDFSQCGTETKIINKIHSS
ncbi:unnamed protein product, partial [Discosporangium mesarthrocarpum]